MMNETMQLSAIAINKWFYWCYNYEDNFIAKIWGPREPYNLTDHLTAKFDALYDRYGSRAVMNVFYAELDGGNKKKLLEYVLTNYNDEVKLNFKED